MESRCISEPEPTIFLSHSGQEKPFVEQLWRDLKRVKQRSFFDQDSDSLPKAEKFAPEIARACRTCRLGVVVVSEGYLTSKWPMLELREFVDHGRKLFPLFLKLSPSDLKQSEVESRWKPAWRKLVESGEVKEEVVELWSEAVKELRSSNGLEYGKYANSEYKYRDAVVVEICKLLPPVLEWDVEHIQGYKRLCEATSSMFDSEVVGERKEYLGLYGMSGVGKTTLCKAMCSYLQGEFGGRVFYVELGCDQATERLARVRRAVQQMSGYDKCISESIMTEEQGWACLKHGLKDQPGPVFVAIDNVGDSEDSRQEAREYVKAKLPSGSKIMVTARSQEIVLSVLMVQGGEWCTKPMPRLEWEEAATLFLSLAAPTVQSVSSLNPEEKEIVSRCLSECQYAEHGYPSRQYHPLVLRALGTYFYDVDRGALNVEKWRAELKSTGNKLQRCREFGKVYGILGLNYHSLPDDVKLVFVDSALCSHDLHWKILSWWALGRSELDMWVAWLSDRHEVSPSDARMMVKELQRLSLLEASSSKVLVHDLYKEFSRVLVETKQSKEREWWMSRSEETTIQGSNDVMRLGSPRNNETSLIGRAPRKVVQDWKGLVFLHLFECDGAGPVLELAGLNSLRALFVTNCDRVKRIVCSCDDNGDEGSGCHNSKPCSWGCLSELVAVRVECSNPIALHDMPFLKHCWNLQSLRISIPVDGIEPVYPAESEAIDFRYLKRLRLFRLFGGRAMLGYDTGAFMRWLLSAFQLESLTVFQYRGYEGKWNGVGRGSTIDLSEAGELCSRLSVLSLRLPREFEEVTGLHLLSELTTLDLGRSQGLRRLQPDLRMLSKLKLICLDGCCNLEAHPSVGPGVQHNIISDQPSSLTEVDHSGLSLSTCIEEEVDAVVQPCASKVKSLVWIWRNTVRSVALEDEDPEVKLVSNHYYTVALEECCNSRVKLLCYQPDLKEKWSNYHWQEWLRSLFSFLSGAVLFSFFSILLATGRLFPSADVETLHGRILGILAITGLLAIIAVMMAEGCAGIRNFHAAMRLVEDDLIQEQRTRWDDFQAVGRAVFRGKYGAWRRFASTDVQEKKPRDRRLQWSSMRPQEDDLILIFVFAYVGCIVCVHWLGYWSGWVRTAHDVLGGCCLVVLVIREVVSLC